MFFAEAEADKADSFTTFESYWSTFVSLKSTLCTESEKFLGVCSLPSAEVVSALLLLETEFFLSQEGCLKDDPEGSLKVTLPRENESFDFKVEF